MNERHCHWVHTLSQSRHSLNTTCTFLLPIFSPHSPRLASQGAGRAGQGRADLWTSTLPPLLRLCWTFYLQMDDLARVGGNMVSLTHCKSSEPAPHKSTWPLFSLHLLTRLHWTSLGPFWVLVVGSRFPPPTSYQLPASSTLLFDLVLDTQSRKLTTSRQEIIFWFTLEV